VLTGSPRTPLLLLLDTPLLLWSRLVLGSIAAALIRIHTLHSIVLCTHHHTHTHTSAPHAEAYTCCWPCSWCCFHNLSFDVNHARTHHVMMCQTMPSFYTFLTIYLDVTSGTRAPESLMLSLKQLQAQADNNLLTADEEETEHVCKQLTILPTQSQACMAAGSMHTKAKIGCWL